MNSHFSQTLSIGRSSPKQHGPITCRFHLLRASAEQIDIEFLFFAFPPLHNTPNLLHPTQPATLTPFEDALPGKEGLRLV